MISDFNYFNQPEQPILTLCNPDDTELGVITNAEDVSLSIRFNDISDLSYKIYQNDDEDYNDRVYNKHIERRQVNVAGVGYFIITGVSEVEDDAGVYKNIQAKSCEYELNNIAAPYINGTYCLYKPENFDADSNEQIAQRDDEYLNENCVLYEVMKVIPAWRLEQIKFVEGEQKYTDLASTFRTFESSDTTVYSFFKSEIQKNYNCFVEFDIEHRIIRVLHYDDVFIEEPVILSKANVLNSCEVSTTIDNYVNTFNVEGQDGVSIASCNPMGNTLIYNFDHDINTGLIDGVLKEALIYWKESLISDPNFTLNEDSWILLPDFVSEWLSFDKTLADAQDEILKVVDLIKDSAETAKGLREAVYKSVFPTSGTDSDIIATIKNSLSWWYTHGHMSNDLQTTFEAYGKSGDLINTLKVLLNPNLAEINEDDFYLFGITIEDEEKTLSNEAYIKNIRLFFSQSTNLAKAYYMRDLALYGITHENTFTTIGDYNKLLLCAQSNLSKIESETDKINSYIEGYNSQLASISTTQVEENANRESLDKQKTLLETYINNSNKALEIYENIKLELNSTVETIQNGVRGIYNHNSFEGSFERYLSEHTEHAITASELYANLTRYFKQQTYTNDTIVITEAMGDAEKYAQERDLYNESVDLLKELSIPAYEVNIGAESFMMTPVFKDVLNGMNIKSAFYVELPNNDVPLFHLLEININYEEKSCEFKLGNRLNISNPAAILSELQATASSAASIVAAERINWGIREEKINLLMEAKSADIDTTFRAMKNSLNNTTIGADGLRCYALDENGNPSYGFWGANGALMFTDENNKPKMAIGRILRNDGEKDYYEYGMYGQSIIANTITADKLVAGTLSRGSNYIRNGSFETGYIPIKGNNYIKNGSFEQFTTSERYGTILTEWVDNIAEEYRFIEDAHAGDAIPLGEHYYSARAAEYEHNGIISSEYISSASQSIDLPLSPGTYTLSFYYRENTDTTESYSTLPSVKLYNSGILIASLEPSDSDIEEDCNGVIWYRCCVTFTVIEELSNASINLDCDTSYCVDGVLLEEGNTLNEYSDYLGTSPIDMSSWSPGLNSVSLYDIPTPIGSKCFSVLTYRDGFISQDISSPMDKGIYTLSFYYHSDDNTSANPYIRIHEGDVNNSIIGCRYSDNQESIEVDGITWYRCHTTVNLDTAIAKPVATIYCPIGTYIDGVMLEKSAVLNDYSNYLTETYAKYTTIDDNGVTVYNGKLKILDDNGVTVFGADDNGDLYIKGSINASSGEIGGWTISKDGLYRDNSGMSTNGEIIFYAGEEIISETEARYNFRVNRQGLLYATNATIGESLTLETYGNDNTNDGLYRVTLTGSSMIMQNKYSNRMSGIFFAGDVNGETITESSNNANLALMGYKQILFGNYSSSKWNHICTMGTDGDTLYFCPAKTSKSESDATEAYLGTEERPWTSLYIKSTLAKKTKKMEPELITYVVGIEQLTGLPLYATRYILCAQSD